MSVQATSEQSCTASVPVVPKTLCLRLSWSTLLVKSGLPCHIPSRSVSDTAGSYEGPAAANQSELGSVSHPREALGWACAMRSRGFQAGSQGSLVPAVYSREVTSPNASSSSGEVTRWQVWDLRASQEYKISWRFCMKPSLEEGFYCSFNFSCTCEAAREKEQNSVFCLFSKVSTRQRLEEHTSILYFFSRSIEI